MTTDNTKATETGQAPEVEEVEAGAPPKPGKPWQMWVTIGAATVPSILSLAWTVYTIHEIVGGLLGVAIGLIVDALIIATVVIAWVNPSIRTGASVIGWVGALGAAVLLAHHHWGAEEAAFAVGPIISKLLWTLALVALTAREKAKEADDSSLTLAQRKTLAQLENEATFAELEAAAKIRRDNAKAKAASDAKIAQTHREMEEKLARLDATETLRTRKYESEERLELLSPPRPRLALGSGSYAPDDARDITGSAGFGGGMAQARAASSPTMGTCSAEQVPTPAQQPPKGGARTSAEEGERNRALVRETLDRMFQETGKVPSMTKLAEEVGMNRRTVIRHLQED